MEVDSTYTITLDDDPMVFRIIAKVLGIKSLPFTSAKKLRDSAAKYQPAGVFVDINLGVEESGLDIIPELRRVWPYCPIIVITGAPEERAVADALASGANDFIRKPLQPDELLARFQVRCREMAQRSQQEVAEVGDLRFSVFQRSLEGPKGLRFLSPSEAALFLCLANAVGTLVNRTVLKRRVWGKVNVTNNALDRKLHSIRSTLKEISNTVQLRSVYGKGCFLSIS